MKRIQAFLKNISISEKLVYCYVLLLPIMKSPNLPLLAQKVQYADLAFLVLFFAWLLQVIRCRKIESVPLIFFIMAMLASFLFSLINSDKWLLSIVEFAGMAYLTALYFLLFQVIRSEAAWRRVLKVWVFTSVIVVVLGFIGYALFSVGVNTIFMQNSKELGGLDSAFVHHMVSTFQHGSMLATYIHTSIIFVFILMFNSEAVISVFNKHISRIVTLAVYLFAAMLTKARSNLGIALSTFLILMRLPHADKIMRLFRQLIFLYLLIMIIAVPLVTVWYIFPVEFNFDNNNHEAAIKFNTTSNFYLVQNVLAVNMIKAHPLLGVGMGMFNYNINKYCTDPDTTDRAYSVLGLRREAGKKGHDPHSTYLGWASETGLTGLFFIMLFFLKVSHAMYVGAVNYKYHSFIYYAFLFGLLGYFLNGLHIDILTMRQFWFLIIMGMIRFKLDSSRTPDSCRKSPRKYDAPR